MNSLDYKDYKSACNKRLAGFSSLIDTVQSLVITTLAVEDEDDTMSNIPTTDSMTDTLQLVGKIVDNFFEMTESWGYEK
jgi:hypothetical protein